MVDGAEPTVKRLGRLHDRRLGPGFGLRLQLRLGRNGDFLRRRLLRGESAPQLRSTLDASLQRFARDTLRRQLAAAYRLVDHFGWTELIYGHLTARVPGEEPHFLINPFGLHYREVTASNLVLIDAEGHLARVPHVEEHASEPASGGLSAWLVVRHGHTADRRQNSFENTDDLSHRNLAR